MTAPGPRLTFLICILVLLVVVGGLSGCGRSDDKGLKYHCPMHPTYVSDQPGDCPICGMRLVPIEQATAPASTPACVCPLHHDITSDTPERCPKCGMEMVPNAECGPACAGASTGDPAIKPQAPGAAAKERKLLFYRNPMDPSVTSPVPAKDPMGMDYVPVYDDAPKATITVKGLAPVEMSPQALRLAGVQTAEARREPIDKSVRTVGLVVPDERRIRHVHTKIAGWIEKLHVNFTGQVVRKGEPILAIYSPELLATEEEFLRVREAATRFSTSDMEEVRRGGDEMLAAARRRLQLFDVPTRFIDELERRGTPQRTVTLLAPVSGFVTAKSTFEGQQVEPGQELFTVTDISSVWIEADIYEFEAPLVRVGQGAVINFPYDPTYHLSGRVTYINPFLSPETRTLKARFEFPNPDFRLKPSMYADVELQVDAGEAVVVPDSAVMDTGTRQVLFVEHGAGRFEPREVRVGIRSSGRAQILEGLKEGETVVVHANFLLDSESRLRAAIAGTSAATPEHGNTETVR